MKPEATVSWFSRELFFPSEEVFDWGDIVVGVDAIAGRYDGKGVSVAVLDTGIDRFHPDLSVSLGIDFAGGYTSTDFRDTYGHGTFVAGVLACLRNKRGLVGICPAIRLIVARIGRFNEETRSYDNDVVEALEKGVDWAVDSGANVVNLSVEFQTIPTAAVNRLEAVFQRAVSRGIILVGSAGNGGRNEVAYPASSKLILGVGAFGDTQEGPVVLARVRDTEGRYYIPLFSNYGRGLDVIAPGVRVPSTLPIAAGSYAWGNGTSIAAPYVSGVCAVMLEADRVRRTASQTYVDKMYKAIRESAWSLPGIASDFQGAGVVNLPGALRALGSVEL